MTSWWLKDFLASSPPQCKYYPGIYLVGTVVEDHLRLVENDAPITREIVTCFAILPGKTISQSDTSCSIGHGIKRSFH